jgi:signal transduction histidine kinase
MESVRWKNASHCLLPALVSAAQPVVRTVEARLREQGIGLRCTRDSAVGARIDHTAFQTVRRNLLDNSVKYSARSAIDFWIARAGAQAVATTRRKRLVAAELR